MANQKISELTTLIGADVQSTSDLIPIVDNSATETKKITPEQLLIGMGVTATAAELNQLDDNTFDTQVNVPSIVVSGTNGSGHADLRWQASNPTAGGNHTALFADANGDINIKKDGGAVEQLATTGDVTNLLTGTITNGDTTHAPTGDAVYDALALKANSSDLSNYQPLDSDLTSIAGLTPSNDDIIQRKSGAWTNRTPAQLKTDLSLTKSDVGLGNVVNVDTTTTANITDSSNKRFITDAQQTVLGNTSGTNTGDQLTFKTIAVSGQSDVVADTTTDTLTLVAGSNVTITTDATTDSITINAGSSTVTKISNTYTAQSSDDVIDCTSGTFNLTLPTAVGINGKKYTIKNSGTGIITIDTTSSQTIDGSLTLKLGTQYNSITVCSDGSNWIALYLRSVNIQTFTSSGTWTKPAGAKICQVIALGAGGGGGSGRRGASLTVRSGGAGGGSGALINYTILASALGASETITVGAGGAGGAGVTTDDTNGNTGGDGTDTTVGTVLRARGGKGGPGGTNSTPITAGTFVGCTSLYEEAGLAGGNGGTSGGSTTNASGVIKPTAGGGGAGKTAGDNNANGAAGGSITQNNGSTVADAGFTGWSNVTGGTLGSGGSGANGNESAAVPYYFGMKVGTGGGGGGSNNSGTGPAGGNGGGPGAGGGGGAGIENGRNGGKGGDGGNGWCVIVTYL